MDWMFLPYRRYADFSGRSRRKEFWLFTLFFYVILLVIPSFGIGLQRAGGPQDGPISNIALGLMGLFVLGTFIPLLAARVRRLHDRDMSGWFVLLSLVPYVGGLALLVIECLPGTKGPNRFGEDPTDFATADDLLKGRSSMAEIYR